MFFLAGKISIEWDLWRLGKSCKNLLTVVNSTNA